MRYVVVTGASSGIGEAFARQLAAEGENLILIARRLDCLNRLAEALRATHGVVVQVKAVDLSRPEVAIDVHAALTAEGWWIKGLVNNAGFGDRGSFASLGRDRQAAMLQVNVGALMALTHCLIPDIRGADRGFIINVASLAAFQAGPNMAIYYATKAFVLSFTEALHEELKADGVRVSALCPGATLTEFADEANVADTWLFKLGTMTADRTAQVALARRHRAIVVPGARNRLAATMGRLSPRWLSRRVAGLLQA